MNDQLERQLKKRNTARASILITPRRHPRPEVLDAVMKMLNHVFGNPSSFYKEGHKASYMLEDARSKIASLLDVRSDEIFYILRNRVGQLGIERHGACFASKGRHIITSKIEHHAVLHTAEALEKQGYGDVSRCRSLRPDRSR